LAGTLVPFPIAISVPVATDWTGKAVLSVPGGGGPLQIPVQAAYLWPSIGYRLTNAVLLDLQP
jgi:hypothetical protein